LPWSKGELKKKRGHPESGGLRPQGETGGEGRGEKV